MAEVQTSRPSARQRRRQHGYLANAADFHDCNAVLVGLTHREDIARECARPFRPGQPHLVVIMIVFGPHNTPPPNMRGAESVAAELAVAGVLNGNLNLANCGDRRLVLDALAAADSERRFAYTDLVLLAKPTEGKLLEEDMATTTYQYRSPFMKNLLREAQVEVEQVLQQRREQAVQQGLEQGRQQGLEQRLEQGIQRGRVEEAAEILRRIFGMRAFTISPDVAERIQSCPDHGQLETWAMRAFTAASPAEVFTD